MHKRILASIGIAGILIVSGSFLASPVEAQVTSVEQIQSQIRELLAKVAELTKQLNGLQGSSNATVTGSSIILDSFNNPSANPQKHRVCERLTRSLSVGAQGDDVMSLQEFLNQEGYFSANATGYFGPVTAQAVAKWQAAQGVQSIGTFGPLSRERIKIWCGGGNSAQRFTANPQRGTAPLTVKFNTWLSGFRAPGHTYTINFGDGSSEAATNCPAPADACTGPGVNTHTYTANGTYTATLTHTIDPCAGQVACRAAIQQETVGKVQIIVGDQMACTKEYMPVCGQTQVYCITAPCNPVQQTYGNRCEMLAAGAMFVHEGQCKTITTDPASDPQCKTWYDGCNSCSRGTPGGPGMCTLKACAPGDIAQKAYCTSYFDRTVTTNKPPVVSTFSGPTTLSVNQAGTWTISASDPENQQLSYQITWGDEYYAVPTMSAGMRAESFVQTTTFSHTYSIAGTYKVTIVVRDAGGAETKTTTTVKVGNAVTACTMEYSPVCATPYYCLISKFAPGSYPAECQYGKTYSNRCAMNAENAVFKYEGACSTGSVACTADAMQCSDGSWVGRTGPNCQFVCQ